MFAWLKYLYRQLPIVRELHTTQRLLVRSLAKLATLQTQALRAQQELYLRQLLADERYLDPKRLLRHEYQVYSQNGEDGVLAEIFHRIGVKDRVFVELGTGDGLINNTVFLLGQGWQGFWVEGDAAAVRRIEMRFQRHLSDGSLRVRSLFVDAQKIAAALREVGVPDEFDLLSLDVDQNTYWIWAALPHLRPRVVVVEYNATLPPTVDWKVDYHATKWWDGSIDFGASLRAYELLGRKLGYNLVGCETSGTNAFLVRQDLCADHFRAPFDAETHYEPPRYWLGRTQGHRRGYGGHVGR